MPTQTHQKKIIIVGPAYPLRGGGMSTFNERLARAFMNEGHRVSIYTFSLQYPKFFFPGTSQYSTEAPPGDLDIKVLINSVNPLNWIKVGNRLKKERPDIIVVRFWIPFMGPCLGTILRIAKKNRYSKVVCIADNIIPHEERAGDKLFTRYFIKPIDAFITMSKNVLQDLKTFDVLKPAQFVTHPLYDNFGEKINSQVARKSLGIKEDAFVLLFFGFIRKYKGLDILLESIALVKHKIPSLTLVVAGEFYEGKKTYDDQINTLKIQDNVSIHSGFIESTEVRNFFSAADVVVQPYRHATQSGVTPLAYHFEIPMIVTNVGGLAAMVPHDHAGLVASPEAESLASMIELYYSKGKDYFLPGLQEEKKKYKWELMVDAIIQSAGDN